MSGQRTTIWHMRNHRGSRTLATRVSHCAERLAFVSRMAGAAARGYGRSARDGAELLLLVLDVELKADLTALRRQMRRPH
jgi:hypothetical protein